jgi:hypothetical protein
LAVDLTAVPGVPETSLGPEVADALPDSAPPAPWELELEALLWLGRPARHAGAVPVSLGSTRPLVGCGGLIRYASTPVGPYCEALGAAVVVHERKPAVHVPFMAVDSKESLVGGRANWALPKVLGSFEGDARTPPTWAQGAGWEVRVSARPLGPAFPFRAGLRLVQQWPDGTSRTATGRMSSRARVARVQVAASGGPQLTAWLRPGRHLGLLVERAHGTLGPAR